MELDDRECDSEGSGDRVVDARTSMTKPERADTQRQQKPGSRSVAERWNTLRRRVRFVLLRALFILLSMLPRGFGLRVFGALGVLAMRLVPSARRQVLENTRLVFPAWSEAQRSSFPGCVARHLARNLFDFVRLRRYSLSEIEGLVAIEGLENLERARRHGVGVICMSAHVGCWELTPYRMRACGYPVAVVYRRLRDPSLDTYVAARRERFGIETHERDTGARGMIRSLRRGALVGILADQHTRVDSVRVPFFGREAWTPSGPVRLAWRTGAPMVPVVIGMEPDGRHTLRIGEEIVVEKPPPGANGAEVDAAVHEACARCNKAVGDLILARKEQWVWFHRRWR